MLTPKPGEPLLSKFSAGTFATTGLEQRLHNLGINSVVVTGVTTDVCVSTTAREAADRDFRTVIASDACTALSEQLHQASLDTFNLAFGWVRTADEVVRMVRDAPERFSFGRALAQIGTSGGCRMVLRRIHSDNDMPSQKLN